MHNIYLFCKHSKHICVRYFFRCFNDLNSFRLNCFLCCFFLLFGILACQLFLRMVPQGYSPQPFLPLTFPVGCVVSNTFAGGLLHRSTFCIDDLSLLHLCEFGNFEIATRHIKNVFSVWLHICMYAFSSDAMPS